MSTPSFRDLERLSAYLDGQLPPADRVRLDSRLAADPQLRAALEELRRTRLMLQRTPHRRAPRNFTLTPKMAGIRPPVPRLVPVLGWASVTAIVLFLCTFGTSLIGRLSFGPMAAAPKAMATQAPVVSDNGLAEGAPAAQPAPTQEMAEATAAPLATQAPTVSGYGVGGGPVTATQPPSAAAKLPTGTAEPEAPSLMAVSQAATVEPTASAGTRLTKPTPAPTLPPPAPPLLSPLQNGLIALAALIATAALAVFLQSQRRWRKSSQTAGPRSRIKEILLLLAILAFLAVAVFSIVELVRGMRFSTAGQQVSYVPVEAPVLPASAVPTEPQVITVSTKAGLPDDPLALTPDRFTVPVGAEFTYSHSDGSGHRYTLRFPAGAFDQPTDVQFSVGQGAPAPDGYTYAGIGFQMYTVPDPLPLQKPIQVTLQYIPAEIVGDENALVLMVWNGEGWETAGTRCTPASVYTRQPEEDTLQMAVCGMEGYALFAPLR
jgi:anti-sigma factor RsiW